ncbi:MAG: hypothetical protein ABEI52_09650, partial [Halobacteriaceae archaeon]
MTAIEKFSQDPYNARDDLTEVIGCLQEYDQIQTALQTSGSAGIGGNTTETYDTEKLDEIKKTLQQREGRNQLSDSILTVVESLQECRTRTTNLAQRVQTLEDEKSIARSEVEKIEDHINTDAIVDPVRDSGIDWIEPLEQLAAGVTSGQIGKEHISPAAHAAQSEVTETTEAGTKLLEHLSNPERHGQDDIQSAITSAVEELGELNSKVQTAKENTKTIENHLTFDNLENFDPFVDNSWTDVLETTATNIKHGRIGVHYVQEAAQRVRGEYRDADLLDCLLNPDDYAEDEIRSILETSLENLDRYNNIVGGGAKNIGKETIKQTAGRLKRDIPDIGPDGFDAIVADHISSREQELDQLDEGKVMRKYAIYQELTGLETLFSELESTLAGNIGTD